MARGANVVLHRVAVAVLIGVLLFTTAFAISPAFREGVRNLVVSMTAESADLELVTSEAAVGSDLLSHYVFPDCPEEFTLTSDKINDVQRWQLYYDTSGNFIYFAVQQADDKSFSVDTENSENAIPLQIHEFEGILVEKDGTCNIVYADTTHNTFVQLYCKGIDQETALTLISNISFVEN